MLTFSLAVVAVVIVVLVGASISFERRMARQIDALLANAGSSGELVTERELAQLPTPVQRWLRYARVIGTPRPATVRLRQTGQFQMAGRGWVPFAAEQYFATQPPSFLWKATFRLAPLVFVTGNDQYRGGEASIEMRAMSIVSVANKRGGGLNQGDLLRFLGELQWFPAAAVAPYVAWESIDEETASAVITYGGVAASMAFKFAADGRLVESRALRYNDDRGRNERWVNRNDADAVLDGMRVPVSGEARWEYETGPFPYIRWRITALERDRPARFAR